MKNIIIALALSILLTTPVYAAEYPGLLRIISAEDYLIVGVDGNGNEWSRIDCSEDWEPDDLAAVIFDDKGTPNYIYDDVITEMRYVGYVELYQ